MLKTKAVQAALVAAIAVSLVGAAVTSASAVEPNGSASPYVLLSAADGTPIAPGTTLEFASGVIASPTTSSDDSFIGSADATSVYTFVSPRGQETVPANWIAKAINGFTDGTKNVYLPTGSLNTQAMGAPASIKTKGGEYSVGVAFLKNNGLTIADAGASYTYITVTPGTGAWTFESPTSGTPTTPAVGSAEIGLSATTIAAADGTLSLDVPANATAVIGTPTLVDQLSTSTGTLGEFTVKDSRIATHKGWTLTSTVKDFVAGGSTIPAARLTVTPKIVTAKTTAAGITAAAAGAASTTGTPFAEAGDAAAVGDTVLNADLKFVAPATAAAGTYTSKMTLTLVSK